MPGRRTGACPRPRRTEAARFHLDVPAWLGTDYRSAVLRRNGDVLPTLLVDGYVAGVWRPVDDGIEATAFHPLDDATWKGLTAEAEALWALLADRDPDVYRRYGHWWDKGMPVAEKRRIAGD